MEVFLREIGISLQRVSFSQDSLNNMCRCGHTKVRQISPGWQMNPVKFTAVQMPAPGMHWSRLEKCYHCPCCLLNCDCMKNRQCLCLVRSELVSQLMCCSVTEAFPVPNGSQISSTTTCISCAQPRQCPQYDEYFAMTRLHSSSCMNHHTRTCCNIIHN